ncbi:sensor histidine kinase [Oceanibium sediminis]|uniref:sensor histidine kinase n=1 Tax=Oceanibium sediminis TaxID=2026339 RepID=UPI001E36B20F|nr:ATP-binding protein [Oceanibium sediminis]
MTNRNSSPQGGWPWSPAWITGWLLACCLAVAVVALLERRAHLSELTAESARLHAVASQRVNQHDAHMTALSAIAIAGAEQRADLFREVSGAVMRFYPRIIGIFLVALDHQAPALEIGVQDADIRGIIRDAALASRGAPVLLRYPSERPAYMIVKRSPNSDAARYGLALVIDAAALLNGDSAYWAEHGTARRLILPDGAMILGSGPDMAAPQFSRALASNTQPLRLETGMTLTLADMLPPGRIASVVALITLLTLVLHAVMKQRAQVRAAEKRAELSGLESRLSHASRVNALGEMASGMAHELTQPLTAILAQAQAARHLAARGQTERVAGVLDGVVEQTRRASSILERLRNWTRPQGPKPEPIDVRECIGVAETLLSAQAAEIGARLAVSLPRTALTVTADRVELEQVLFNLIRNALDSVAESTGRREVTVEASIDGNSAVIDVADSGPGLSEDIRYRLFTPFATTRADGTGLGLALSQRLVERAGGDLAVVEAQVGAHFRVTLPLAQASREAAE